MHYRLLGRTGLSLSLAGYGTGGPSQFGQASQLAITDQDALIRRALDLGITIIDSAMAYGDSEERLGRALADAPRDRYLLATKLTPTRGGGAADDLIAPADVARLCEESLRRLRTDVIDIYQVHAVSAARYAEVVDRLYPELVKLREAGKIRFIGLTERFFQEPVHTMLEMAVPSGLWDTVMLKYGILNQAAARDVLPLCQQHNVGVLTMAPVRVKLSRPAELSALLADWRARGLVPPDALTGDDPLGWLVHGEVDSVVSAGYRFAADHPAVSTVLIGTGSIAHLEANVASVLGSPLPAADKDRLRALFGHLDEGV